MLGIISSRDDIHALYFATIFEETTGSKCHLIDSSDLSKNRLCSIKIGGNKSDHKLIDATGEWFEPEKLKAIWYRRLSFLNLERHSDLDVEEFLLLRNEHYSVLHGSLDTAFGGVWINDPKRSRTANNKIFQLDLAQKLGFDIPKTLISNNFAEIEEFSLQHNGKIIAKPNYGLSKNYIFCSTPELDEERFRKLLFIPAIYQEMISGSRHLMVNIFGSRVIAFEIETLDLDWRADLTTSNIRQVLLPENLKEKLLMYLEHCGLLMGVFDLKLDHDNKPVFLELNSQGQFLFLEPFGGTPSLVSEFVEFLCEHAL